jgi:bifunctional non-homologous end joining protein LigD
MHEIKFDGYRLLASVKGDAVRLLTRTGLDWTERFQPVADALAAWTCLPR